MLMILMVQSSIAAAPAAEYDCRHRQEACCILIQGRRARLTRSRAPLVSAANTPDYHCIGRYVRRAFIRGMDSVIDRSASALTSNHYLSVFRFA
jgi:hypothetical protein